MIEMPDLSGTSFTSEIGEAKKMMILGIDGLEGDGKTHLALTGPKPLVFQSIDDRHNGVIQKFKAKGGIAYATYRNNVIGDKSDVRERARAEVDRWINDGRLAIKAGVRAVIWDTATELRDLFLAAYWGKCEQLMPKQYGAPHTELSDLIREFRESETSLIIISKMKKSYGEDDKWNGKYERQGMSNIGFLLDAAVTTELVREENEKGVLENWFKVTVTKAGFEPDALGLELRNPTFADIATMVMPESSDKDWR